MRVGHRAMPVTVKVMANTSVLTNHAALRPVSSRAGNDLLSSWAERQPRANRSRSRTTVNAAAAGLWFAFYGRMSTEDFQNEASSRAWQVAKALRQVAGRPADSPGPLVDLAACGTHLTGELHDEALTLATAFLAAGAATVLGSPVAGHGPKNGADVRRAPPPSGQRPAQAARSA